MATEIIALRLEAGLLQLQILGLGVAIQAVQAWAWFTHNPDEALASATGLLGAFLVAAKGKHAGKGWIAFLASNAAWLYFAWRKDHPGLFLQQCGFTVTTLIGLWTWLIAPRLQWTEWRGDFEGNATMWIMPILRWRGRRLDLHKMVRADRPLCYHTHPAPAVRVILWGGYTEEIAENAPTPAECDDVRRYWPISFQTWRPGMVGLVRPQLCHRIHSLRGPVSYSLWIRGRKTHETELRGPGWSEQIRPTLANVMAAAAESHEWEQLDAAIAAKRHGRAVTLGSELEAVDCDGPIRCSTCPGKKQCQNGCMRQGEYVSPSVHEACRRATRS